jgi:hypothetical protein
MPDTLKDRIAIEETKARYCRFLDTKDWSGLASVFAEDLLLDTTDSGGTELRGRNKAVEMVRNSVGDAKTVHQVHSPEISFVDDETADVIWAMQDRVVWAPEKARQIGFQSLTGWGHYHERYVRAPDGSWRIATQRLTRLHMDMQPLEAKA